MNCSTDKYIFKANMFEMLFTEVKIKFKIL